MIRVRFHGRGGHGIKTASRILGSAAFLAGCQVQDSPIYGAERRGAAVAAFTRISDGPIRERGVIGNPDLIVVADETLLDDPAAGVLSGQEYASALFLNVASTDHVPRQEAITTRMIRWDITGRTTSVLGTASALSAGLAAAAARLAGVVSQPQLAAAIADELQHVGIDHREVAANQQIAAEVFSSLPSVSLERRGTPASDEIHAVSFEHPLRGTPSILAAGNAELRRTGTWRCERPEIDYDRCTRCGLCVVRCPDGAISLDADEYPVIDYDHCKGCLLCWDQCPVAGAMTRVKEVRAW